MSLHSCTAYTKGLVAAAQSVHLLPPQGFISTPTRVQEGGQSFEKVSDVVKLDKSNILLLGPTGCGRWSHSLTYFCVL